MWVGATKNEAAFLDMLGISEGTSIIPDSDNGYLALVGGGTFSGYQDHPRLKVYIPRLHYFSTAAGKYQILARYFDAYKALLDLPDFGPDSQDQIALQMIREHKALDMINAGDLAGAVAACCATWASFPGEPYGQGANSFSSFQAAFLQAGGTIGG